MITTIHNLSELETWIQEHLLKEIEDSSLILLMGPLGAGKTEIVKIISKLKGSSPVQSPTFSFHHQYKTSTGLSLHHVDLYRLKSEEDLESIGFWDLLNQESGPFFIEWANLLGPHVWPLNRKKIQIKIIKEIDGKRIIEWKVD
jgi:tRNA threonylcarbamoyladenosine biosynthesis protein TsaE